MTQTPSPTEPGILAFLAKCDAFYPPDAVNATVIEQRGFYDALCAEFSPPLPAGLEMEDGRVEGRIPVRWYRPASLASETVLLYLHGGGFVVGSLESHHAICGEIASTGAALVAVDYRLAPEHVWPAAFEDCFAVLAALLADGRKVVVIGDSAGGNLAAGVVLKARDAGLAGVVGQALVYPALGGDLTTGSYIEMDAAPGLTTADVRYYRAVYAAPDDHPHAFPLLAADLAGLPPTFITVAHFDPLRDDGRAYAARLATSGVEVWFREEPQMVHAWLRARFLSEGAATGFSALCAAVARMAQAG